MSSTLTVELNCPRCNFAKIIKIGLDEDGVYSIPNKFCPNDMHILSREVLPDLPGPIVTKENEPEQNETVKLPQKIAPVPRPVVDKDEPKQDKA